MNINFIKTKLKTLRKGDPGFMLDDGFMMSPRAGLEIDYQCPARYQEIIIQCIDKGWIKPVATVYARDLTFQTLKESK